MNDKRSLHVADIVGALPIAWQILFFYVPLSTIILLGFFEFDVTSFTFSSFTTGFFSVFFNTTFFHVLLRSVGLASLTVLGTLLIGYPVAYSLTFARPFFKKLGLFLLFIPFWTNFLLHVLAWFFILERHGIINTAWLSLGGSVPLTLLNNYGAVLLMMLYTYVPFMILPLYSALENIDKRLVEASKDLGASWWNTLVYVIMPLSVPGIRSGFYLVFIPAFSEFAIPELMGGSKYMFVGSVVTHYMLGGSTMNYGAAFTIISSLVVLAASGIGYLLITVISRFQRTRM